jgi:hypothetical protein
MRASCNLKSRISPSIPFRFFLLLGRVITLFIQFIFELPNPPLITDADQYPIFCLNSVFGEYMTNPVVSEGVPVTTTWENSGFEFGAFSRPTGDWDESSVTTVGVAEVLCGGEVDFKSEGEFKSGSHAYKQNASHRKNTDQEFVDVRRSQRFENEGLAEEVGSRGMLATSVSKIHY